MSVSKRLRFEILRRDNHRCRYCGATALVAPLTVDHVTPTALGGTDLPDNLVTACEPCNSGKTSTTADGAVLDLTARSALPQQDQRDAWELLGTYEANELRSPAASSAPVTVPGHGEMPTWVVQSLGAWANSWLFRCNTEPADRELEKVKANLLSAAHTFSGPVLFFAAQSAARSKSTAIEQYARPLQNAVEAELRRAGL